MLFNLKLLPKPVLTGIELKRPYYFIIVIRTYLMFARMLLIIHLSVKAFIGLD